MQARVTNYGRTQAFPTCIGNIFLYALRPVELDSEKTPELPRAVRELKKFPLLGIEILDGSINEDLAIDYGRYQINELRHIATELGVKKAFFMNKPTLIKILKEKK